MTSSNDPSVGQKFCIKEEINTLRYQKGENNPSELKHVLWSCDISIDQIKVKEIIYFWGSKR
jgi:hypothetical protein